MVKQQEVACPATPQGLCAPIVPNKVSVPLINILQDKEKIKVNPHTLIKFSLHLEGINNHLPTPSTYGVTCDLGGWESDNFVVLRGSGCR